MPLGSIYRITQELELVGGTTAKNVYHLAQVSVGADTAFNIGIDFEDYLRRIYQELEDSLHDTTIINEFIVEIFDDLLNKFTFFVSGLLGIQGNEGPPTQPMPQGCAILAQGRHVIDGFSGKKFFGGLTEGVHLNGLWIGSAVADAGFAAIEWVTPFAGVASTAAFQPVTFGDVEASPKSISGNITVDNIVAYQRRRKPGVGE